MSSQIQPVFARLRGIFKKHAAAFAVAQNTSNHYSLEAPIGPATVRAWAGKMKSPTIPVAWVQIGKAYVSYHLMGVYGNAKLREGMSKELKARMQGKTSFNFKTPDEALLKELDHLTAQAIAGFRKAGYIVG